MLRAQSPGPCLMSPCRLRACACAASGPPASSAPAGREAEPVALRPRPPRQQPAGRAIAAHSGSVVVQAQVPWVCPLAAGAARRPCHVPRHHPCTAHAPKNCWSAAVSSQQGSGCFPCRRLRICVPCWSVPPPTRGRPAPPSRRPPTQNLENKRSFLRTLVVLYGRLVPGSQVEVPEQQYQQAGGHGQAQRGAQHLQGGGRRTVRGSGGQKSRGREEQGADEQRVSWVHWRQGRGHGQASTPCPGGCRQAAGSMSGPRWYACTRGSSCQCGAAGAPNRGASREGS